MNGMRSGSCSVPTRGSNVLMWRTTGLRSAICCLTASTVRGATCSYNSRGLSDEQLRRPVLPSGWSCLGLVRHLTLSDERYWFGVVVAGERLDFWPEGDN